MGPTPSSNRPPAFQEMYEKSVCVCVCVFVHLSLTEVYMQSMHGDGIIDWAAKATTAPSAMVIYEQTHLGAMRLDCGTFPPCAVFLLGW